MTVRFPRSPPLPICWLFSEQKTRNNLFCAVKIRLNILENGLLHFTHSHLALDNRMQYLVRVFFPPLVQDQKGLASRDTAFEKTGVVAFTM